jgi:hypothetical protein
MVVEVKGVQILKPNANWLFITLQFLADGRPRDTPIT